MNLPCLVLASVRRARPASVRGPVVAPPCKWHLPLTLYADSVPKIKACLANPCLTHHLVLIFHHYEKTHCLYPTLLLLYYLHELGGTFMLTMLSKRRLRIDQEKLNSPKEISRNTWVFNDGRSDKRHPHYYCSAVEMLTLFQGFEVKWMEDREHDKPGSWHWYLILERTA